MISLGHGVDLGEILQNRFEIRGERTEFVIQLDQVLVVLRQSLGFLIHPCQTRSYHLVVV